MQPLSLTFAVAALLLGQDPEPEPAAEQFWPRWRGPLDTGAAPHAQPPVRWGEDENLRWKAEIPGKGHSTPVIWGSRVFLTTAVAFGEAVDPEPEVAPGAHDNAPVDHHHKFVVLAVERDSGEIAWQREVSQTLPHERAHVSASFASGSPVTDGEHLFAFFGSRGLYALDLDGEVIWNKDLGAMSAKHEHGEGSSPALHGDTLVVNWDHEAQSFVAAFDKRTGEQRWRVPRDEVTSWATPIVVEVPGTGAQVIVPGSERLRAYALDSGEVIWECGGLSHNVVASPVAAGGMVFSGSSYERQALLVIRLEGARGDLTRGEDDHLVWVRRRGAPYVPSPLLYADKLYFLRHYQPLLHQLDASTGAEPEGPFRLAGLGNIYASPVAAAGRIYLTDLEGATLVLSAGSKPETLALNHLDDSFSASVALSGRELYLRGAKHLYCIAED